MIWDVSPGSGSRIRNLIFLPTPDPGVKEAPDPGSRFATLPIWIRNNLFGSETGSSLTVICSDQGYGPVFI
jgi:hypothetical protein